MRPLKICDTVQVAEIADGDLSDYNKGIKSLMECKFKNFEKKVYKIIDVDFIKCIDYNDDNDPMCTICFKDNTTMQLYKIHLEEIFLKWSEGL